MSPVSVNQICSNARIQRAVLGRCTKHSCVSSARFGVFIVGVCFWFLPQRSLFWLHSFHDLESLLIINANKGPLSIPCKAIASLCIHYQSCFLPVSLDDSIGKDGGPEMGPVSVNSSLNNSSDLESSLGGEAFHVLSWTLTDLIRLINQLLLKRMCSAHKSSNQVMRLDPKSLSSKAS